MTTTYLFEVEELDQLREQAADAWMEQLPEDTPEGWSTSPIDLEAFVAAFDPLRLMPRLVLRAYQFRSGNNGNAFVWAMPEDVPMPPPGEGTLTDPPRPPGALDNVMEALEGDGSPLSYMYASLFAREVAEVGAAGHGANWDAYAILAGNPWADEDQPARTDAFEGPTGAEGEWSWNESPPVEWRPTVEVGKQSVLVSFYTYCGLGYQRITRHVDTYVPGGYCFTTEKTEVATGADGYRW